MPQRSTSTRTSTTARTPSSRTATSKAPPGADPQRRPAHRVQRQNTALAHTRYMEMLLALDKVPRLHNILAAFFGWLLLAGFVVFPGTFTSVQAELASSSSSSTAPPDVARALLLDRIDNPPLLVVAAVACGAGALGLLGLAVRWRRNYVWLLGRVFLPAATNALAGLISTLVAVYAQKGGDWSIMARVTGAVEAGDLVVCGVLCVLTTVMLRWVKREHEKEVERLEKEEGGEGGFMARVGKK